MKGDYYGKMYDEKVINAYFSNTSVAFSIFV